MVQEINQLAQDDDLRHMCSSLQTDAILHDPPVDEIGGGRDVGALVGG
jgi:hypothetical protein